MLLNKFPYASGHLMVAPYRHLGDFAGLDGRRGARGAPPRRRGDDGARRHLRARRATTLGWNLGRIAGAGIVDHVHLHVVPRWSGDTNFMPVLADVKVLPEHLAETREKLAAAWPR